MNGSLILAVFLLTLAGFGVAVLAMAIGPMFGRRCLRGSCGGAGGGAAHDDRIACVGCPNAPSVPASGDADGASGRPPRHREGGGPERD